MNLNILRKKKKKKHYLGLAAGLATGFALGFGLCVADEMKKIKEKQEEEKPDNQSVESVQG